MRGVAHKKADSQFDGCKEISCDVGSIYCPLRNHPRKRISNGYLFTRLAIFTPSRALCMVQTFYRTARSGGTSEERVGRDYLKSALLAHPLWRDLPFWNEACWCAPPLIS
jgi:hypothetical protein